MQRQNLLEFGQTSSDESSLNDALDNIANDPKPLIDSLTGWKIKSSVEKKLVLGILHSRGHKNFEEREQDEHEKFQTEFSLL